jgi:hypothetical protein
MKVRTQVKNAAVTVVALMCGAVSYAQSGQANTVSGGLEATADVGDAEVFLGQRLWIANWAQALLDTQIVVPDPANPAPVIRRSLSSSVSGTSTIPITSAGVRYKGFSITGTYFAPTRFGTEGLAQGDSVRRREADLGVGYLFTPNISGSIVYKAFKADRATTASTAALTGVNGGYKIDGLLLGISASAPLQGRLSLYGNAAFGLGRQKANFNGESIKNNLNYRIGEIGFSYRVNNESALLGIKNLSVQLGYRAQIVTLNNVEVGTLTATPVPTPIAIERRKINSTTDGFVLGVAALF